MAAYTRRTHMVRITAPPNPFTPTVKPMYVDIEVLDAVAFRTTNGEVMVLNTPTSRVRPWIVDNTVEDPVGSGKNDNTKTEFGRQSTRRSHMKRIKSPTTGAYFDIEILDNLAFNDQNGREWVLKMPSADANPYNTTEGSSLRGGKGSRRTHLEVLTGHASGGGGCGGCGGGPSTAKMVVERVDMMSFRTTMGREMIVKCPSADDGSAPRANTYTTPVGYDASTGLPNPPPNTDPNVYFAFVSKIVHVPPVFDGGLSGWAYTLHDILDNNTFHSLPIYNSSAEASAAGQAVLDDPSNTNLGPPLGTEFVVIPPTQTQPAHDEVVSGPINSGERAGADTTKISMGPFWWIRRFSMDGEDGPIV